MDKNEMKLYHGMLDYYIQYSLDELIVLRKHLLRRWELVTDVSAQNLIRDEIKIELNAIDATMRDLFMIHEVEDLIAVAVSRG